MIKLKDKVQRMQRMMGKEGEISWIKKKRTKKFFFFLSASQLITMLLLNFG